MEPLRPMSTGELLDRAFALYRKNFGLFVGIAMVTHGVYLGYELLSIKPAAVIRGPRFGASYYLSIVLALAFLTIVTTISQAATVKAVAAVHLDQKTSVWAAYGSLRRRIFSVFGILILVFLVAAAVVGVLVVLLIAVVAMANAVVGNNILPKNGAANLILGFGIILGVLASFVAVYVRYALAIQACVVENLGSWASMKRSVSLSKDGRLRIAAVYVLFLILSWIASVSFAWIARLAATPWHSRIASIVVIQVAGFVAGSLTGPLATIGISLLYYDERVRKEAFDLHLMMASIDAEPQPLVAQVEV
jgi:hypothetical protein